jgi:thiol-disulfide isomerase/thioredoxin
VSAGQPAAGIVAFRRLRPVARIAGIIGFLALIIGLLWAIQGGAKLRTAAPSIGAAAPNFIAADLTGQSRSLDQSRGHPVILNFWATWCEPCKAEMPAITAVAKTDPNVVVLAVNVLEGPVLVQTFARDYALGFVPLLDPSGTTARQYQVNSLPSSFFIAPNGTIRAINIGPMDQPMIEQNLRRASS